MFTALEVAKICNGAISGNGNAVSDKVVTDSRKIEKNNLFIALSGENFDGNLFAESAMEKGASIVVVSRDGINPKADACVIKVENTGDALLKMGEAARDKSKAVFVAVTGSIGKTTTKEMCACALSAALNTHKTQGNFNNDIGMPLTLLELNEEHEAAVIEMGMNHFGEIERLTLVAKPDIAMITNIGLSHIENLGSQENILKAKMEIVKGLKKGGTLIVNGDDSLLKSVKSDEYNILTYGLYSDCDVKGEILSENSVRVLGETINLSVSGEHNLLNACGAMAVAKTIGISLKKAAEGISGFKTDNRRQSITKSDKGFYVISDYYNAAPQSVEAAIKMLSVKEGRKIAVLGDMLELGEYSKVSHEKSGQLIKEYGIDILLCYGEASYDTYKQVCDEKNIIAKHFDDKDKLSSYLMGIAEKDDYILIKGSRGMKMETIYEKIMG